MPTYDMECERCGRQFEVFRQGFLTDADRSCTSCGATATQRLTGFVTSRPSRGRTEPSVRSFGGHSCGAGCGCATARRAPNGEIIPP